MRRIERTILSRLEHPLGFYELLSVLDYDLRSVVAALNSLQQQGLIRVRDGLIERTAAFTHRHLGESHLEGIKREFEDLVRNRPEPVVKYDQGYVTADSVMNRLRALDSRDDLSRSSVFLLGDDDLTSIALCLTGLPTRVAVAEIDPRLLDFLDGCRRHLPVPLELYEYDVRNSLPSELVRTFDVSFCDPLETEQGFRLFILRCREALSGPGSALYFGLTDIECSPERWFGFQEFLLRAGLRITDLWRSIHRYVLPERDFVLHEIEGADRYARGSRSGRETCFWYHSSLVRAELVFPSNLPPEPPGGDSDIYT